MSRLLLRSLVLAVALWAVLDALISLSVLRDGRLFERPLPPYAAITDPAQEAAIQRMLKGEEGPSGINLFDAELGWNVRPGSRSPDGLFTINAAGQRGLREYSPKRPDASLRLACFGDSFTFGDEVQDAWCYPAMLEQRNPGLEALNYGVGAYGTDQALLRWRREGRHDAQVVVLGMLLENIGRNVNRYRPLWYPRSGAPLAKPRFLLNGEGLELLPQPYPDALSLALAARDGSVLEQLKEHEYWSGKPQLWTGRWCASARILGGWWAYRVRSPRRLWLDPEGEPRLVTLAIAQSFQREVLASGASAAPVLLFPLKQELAAYAEDGVRWWQAAVDALEQRGLQVIDPIDALAQRQEECQADPRQGELYFGGHLSSVGNEVVARCLEQWLVEQGCLDAR